jgi:ubiquitin carboxyl-terminal hydrolase 8
VSRPCKETGNASRSFYKLPKILVVHLKRFKYGGYGMGKKIDTSVVLRETLDLSEFVEGTSKKLLTQKDDPSVSNPYYDLYGIVEHMGSLNGGHYTAYLSADLGFVENPHRRLGTASMMTTSAKRT